MAIKEDALIIGLTGSFGSGCSTLREALQDKGCKAFSLSEFVREEWGRRNVGKSPQAATRKELQDVGNELRREHGNGFLAEKALEKALNQEIENELVVFDSFRHPDEIAIFRNKYTKFFLVAVDSTFTERWERLKDQYKSWNMTQNNFEIDDARDASEDITYGQKVQLCVDDADIAIKNERHLIPKPAQKDELTRKINSYIDLITGKDPRATSPDESMMALAYAKALSSSCYKRQVGAVIVDENGLVIGAGCNNNPSPLSPCYEEFGECYRDIYKKDMLKDFEDVRCPDCHQVLKGRISTDYKCECGFDVDKYFFRDKALSRCTALHAEEAAIISVGGRNLKGCTMYTTTFPCFTCAQKIIASEIKKVFYGEPYPDPDSAMLFDRVNKGDSIRKIPLIKFEGVKARAYFRLFGSWRRQTEDRIIKKRE